MSFFPAEFYLWSLKKFNFRWKLFHVLLVVDCWESSGKNISTSSNHNCSTFRSNEHTWHQFFHFSQWRLIISTISIYVHFTAFRNIFHDNWSLVKSKWNVSYFYQLWFSLDKKKFLCECGKYFDWNFFINLFKYFNISFKGLITLQCKINFHKYPLDYLCRLKLHSHWQWSFVFSIFIFVLKCFTILLAFIIIDVENPFGRN